MYLVSLPSVSIFSTDLFVLKRLLYSLALITCPVILNQPPEKKISEENQRRYAFRIVDLLLPWLKELQQEQMKEKELEGRLQGVSMDEVKLEQADCDMDERVYWLNIFPVYILP
jgi:hypothetical protein